MQGFWIEFEGNRHTPAYCEGSTPEDATHRATTLTGCAVANATPLPYPAEPILWQADGNTPYPTPAFCYSPTRCKGRTSCPRRPSCVS